MANYEYSGLHIVRSTTQDSLWHLKDVKLISQCATCTFFTPSHHHHQPEWLKQDGLQWVCTQFILLLLYADIFWDFGDNNNATIFCILGLVIENAL